MPVRRSLSLHPILALVTFSCLGASFFCLSEERSDGEMRGLLRAKTAPCAGGPLDVQECQGEEMHSQSLSFFIPSHSAGGFI